jgi:hypothetical protein
MKRLAVLVIAISLAACTTLRPIEGTPFDLQQHIAAGELLKSGDRVKIGTSDGQTHEFAVTAIHDGVIEGKNVALPIANVVAVDKRTTSVGKTAALIGAILLTSAAAIVAEDPYLR